MLWISCGSCSGESMAVLGVDGQASDLMQFLEEDGVRLLWHPSISAETPHELAALIRRIERGDQPLTILCVEGSIAMGPNGTGMYDTFLGRPKRDLVRLLCDRAESVVALGTCAAYGGIPAAPPNPTDAVGLQFGDGRPGGLLGAGWRSRSGLPVVNVAGCSADADTMIGAIRAVLASRPTLDRQGRPEQVRPCLSTETTRRCGTADRVGHSCYGCIAHSFPSQRRLVRWTPVTA